MDNVAQWLQQLGLSQYASVFAANDIDEEVLTELTDTDLEKLGVTLGHRKKLLKAIAALRADSSTRGTSGPSDSTEPADPQRRQLTVMFCDLVGSTRLSEKLDPEDLRDIIRAYQDACRSAIERYEGYVARYVGDGVLAYFGYPQAHEDEPERAVRAGLGVVEAMDGLNAGVGKNKDVELAVRVGIATGPVVVGDLIGEGASEQRTAVGETTNLAARLQGLAGADTVVIADSTRRLLTQTFDFQDLGNRHLDGFRESQKVWTVLRPTRVPGRFEAQHAADLTTFVGRNDELTLLHGRWRLADAGKGQVVLVDGEPGVGKSRIVRSLRERMAGDRHIRLFCQCSPYYTNSPLYPFIRHLERAAHFEDGEPANTKLEKLSALLARSTCDLETVTPLFATLMSVPFAHRFRPLDGTPEQRKERTLEAIIDQLRGLSERQPILAVFEDVHWIDPTSLELLGRLVERVADLRVLLIITFRPEFEQPWPRYSHLTTVSLSRLDAECCLAMVEDITRNSSMPLPLTEQIVRKADGIPLFVEELTKTVLEYGAAAEHSEPEKTYGNLPALAIPSTLQASLMARLDRLGEARWVAQIGSAIGREFSYELLAEVASRPQKELGAALQRLVDSGLVFEDGTPPKATYTFKHALVQDEAYESLLLGRRPELHMRIADAMERRLQETQSSIPELLAHHCARAKLTDKAIHYWQLASERAIERSANLEALSHLTNALAALEDLPDTPARKEQELALLITAGPLEFAIEGSGSPGAEQAYTRAVALCEQLPDSPQHFAAYWGQWRTSKSYTVNLERADKLLALAENLGDPGLRLQAHHCQWASLFNLGFHRQCCEHVEHGLQLYEAGDFRSHASVYGGHDPAVCGHGEAALSSWLLGRPEQAVAHLEQALAVAHSLSHAGSTAHAMDIASMLHRYRQDAAEVHACANRMIAFSEHEEFAAFNAKGEIFRGWALMRLGRLEEGFSGLRKGIDAYRAIGSGEDLPVFLEMLAEGYGLTGQASQGLLELDTAFEEADKAAMRYWQPELLRRQGELLLAVGKDGDEARAETSFIESLQIARRQQAKSLELRTAMSYSRLLQRSGKTAAASELLAPVYRWFTEGFDFVDLVDAKAQLDELKRRSGAHSADPC
ncbi:MAG: AAA family ATPase [Gammaproteobacteria bacterium]|nr:AAA family ATPase [Gammaproteobacteria bacterium]